MALVNRAITAGCIGVSCSIYTAWNYSERGLAYDAVQSVFGPFQQKSKFPSPSSSHSSSSAWDPARWRQILANKTIHHAGPGQDRSLEAFVLSNFSHMRFVHLAFNMIAWNSFAQIFHHLPTHHYVSLIVGSALASSWMFEREHQNSPGASLGASGIVSGLAMATTMIIPTSRVMVFGIVPGPLWVFTAGFFFLDAYYVQRGTNTGIGHSAHIGGGLFGAAYYALFLRRYGGILAPRRWS